MLIYIHSPTNVALQFIMNSRDTINELRSRILRITRISFRKLILMYQNQVLLDNYQLNYYRIVHKSTLQFAVINTTTDKFVYVKFLETKIRFYIYDDTKVLDLKYYISHKYFDFTVNRFNIDKNRSVEEDEIISNLTLTKDILYLMPKESAYL